MKNPEERWIESPASLGVEEEWWNLEFGRERYAGKGRYYREVKSEL